MRLIGVVAHLRPCANALLRLGRMFPSSFLAMLSGPLCFPSFVHALSDLRLIHATSFMGSSQNSVHPFTICHELFSNSRVWLQAMTKEVSV